jgi:transcriptional regulator with XRE-family HTH domain
MTTETRGATSPVNQAIADEIRATRGRGRLTQQEVADRAEMNLYVYRRYESGERVLNTETMTRIAVALGLTPDQLWRESVSHNPAAFGVTGTMPREDAPDLEEEAQTERLGEPGTEPDDMPESEPEQDETRPGSGESIRSARRRR